MGVTAFQATVKPSEELIDAARLHVTPATVAAIEKAKLRTTEPTIKVDVDGVATIVDGIPPLMDGAPILQMDPSRAQEYAKRRVERAEAFARIKSEHSIPTDKFRIPQVIEPMTARSEAPASRYEAFEDLGLAPKPITKRAQKLVVSSYRLLGFGILSIIVAVLVGYIATTAFYFLNKTWITPVALSANDEKVVALQGELAKQLNERAALVSELDQSDMSIAAEQAFQLQFAKAIQKDLEGRRAALDRVKQLADTAAATRNEIRTTNGDYSASTVSKMENEYKAGLIDRDAMMSGKFQLAQISSANLSLAERQAEFDQRASELSAQTQSLDAVLGDKSATAALSYDVLKIARDYQTSKLAVARETANHDRLKASIAREDQIIAGLNQSGYLRAINDHATVALVPYTNLDNVTKGSPLYACKLNMVICHKVGKVLDILPGEVQVKHPNRDSMLRGRMLELQLTDGTAAQDEVLFAGHRPLGL